MHREVDVRCRYTERYGDPVSARDRTSAAGDSVVELREISRGRCQRVVSPGNQTMEGNVVAGVIGLCKRGGNTAGVVEDHTAQSERRRIARVSPPACDPAPCDECEDDIGGDTLHRW